MCENVLSACCMIAWLEGWVGTASGVAHQWRIHYSLET